MPLPLVHSPQLVTPEIVLADGRQAILGGGFLLATFGQGIATAITHAREYYLMPKSRGYGGRLARWETPSGHWCGSCCSPPHGA
jgi:hypothetical protein